jgi:thiamine biosynthesis lipoprotein
MGCEIVVGGADEDACSAIEALFEKRDRMFSRFRAESELNRVNERSGRPVRVSAAFASMLGLALDAARETDGLVDPTVGAALEAAGYDADFTRLHDDGRTPSSGARGTWSAARVIGRHVLAPAGTTLDLNGVVKSQTVDEALALLPGDGFVAAGGDLAARGGAVVALPLHGTVRLVRGALATSGNDRRRWLRGGTAQHHLIDPRTGAPSRSRWTQVTACGATCVAADIAAKAAFLLDDEGPEWLDARRIPGRFVDADGRSVQSNDAWRRSLEREFACT